MYFIYHVYDEDILKLICHSTNKQTLFSQEPLLNSQRRLSQSQQQQPENVSNVVKVPQVNEGKI